jgi:hypothetical protein
MSVIVLAVGIVVAAVGVATTGFGITISTLPLGPTLLIAGTTALTGGLILIALSAVITELGRVAEALRARSAPRSAARPAETDHSVSRPTPVPADAVPMASAPQIVRPAIAAPPLPPRPKPEPAPPLRDPTPAEAYPSAAPSAVEVSAAAIERLRSSIPRSDRSNARAAPAVIADVEAAPLSPNRPAQPAAEQAKVAADDRPSGSAVDALKASRLDFLFRSRTRAAPPQLENFEAVWSAEGEPVPQSGQDQPRSDKISRQATSVARNAEPFAEEPSRQPTILKSGVVDGMAYTLYADGSIEAKLPQGTVRFGSIAELRTHIESSS